MKLHNFLISQLGWWCYLLPLCLFQWFSAGTKWTKMNILVIGTISVGQKNSWKSQLLNISNIKLNSHPCWWKDSSLLCRFIWVLHWSVKDIQYCWVHPDSSGRASIFSSDSGTMSKKSRQFPAVRKVHKSLTFS